MAGEVDKITGRLKQAAGDLIDDEQLRRQGVTEEQKADAKQELAEAQRHADAKAREVAELERQSARRSEAPDAPTAADASHDPGRP